MSRIGILTISSPEGGGVYQYTLTLIEALKKYINDEYELIQIKSEKFPKVLDKCIEIKSVKTDIITKIKRVIHAYTGFKIGNLLKGYEYPEIRNLDLMISPIITLLPYHMGKPYIVTIHDFQQEYYPKFFTLRERISRKIVYRTAQKADLVVCESEYVKKDITRFLNVSSNKIFVIPSLPPGYIRNVNPIEQNLDVVKKKYNLPDKYLFYPAQFWYHKNHINLIKALKLIKDRYNEKINLILVGSKKNNFENVMNEIKKLNLLDQVKYLGYIPDEDIPYLYKLSTSLVMPTLFESVSMPIWEAFHLGTPVVSSNVCALPEQVGDAGLIFGPIDIEDMADKIYQIWTDEELRKELVKKGYERIKDLTLENYAEQWEEIIEETVKLGRA